MPTRGCFCVTALALPLACGCDRDPAPARGAGAAGPGPVTLPAGAPLDRPVDNRGAGEVAELRAAIAPYVAQGRATWPRVRERYVRGLPAGQKLFALTTLHGGTGADGRVDEQVFVLVESLHEGRVFGRIADEISGGSGFHNGDRYDFPEPDLLDWLISRPDGSEEGNVVGKFLDEWQKSRPASRR